MGYTYLIWNFTDQNGNHFELYLMQNYAMSLVATSVPVNFDHSKIKTVITPSRQSDDLVVT